MEKLASVFAALYEIISFWESFNYLSYWGSKLKRKSLKVSATLHYWSCKALKNKQTLKPWFSREFYNKVINLMASYLWKYCFLAIRGNWVLGSAPISSGTRIYNPVLKTLDKNDYQLTKMARVAEWIYGQKSKYIRSPHIQTELNFRYEDWFGQNVACAI